MAKGWTVNVDGQVAPVESLTQLRSVLDAAAAKPRQEVWLFSPSGPSLCMLRNQDRALLMFLREPGDAGFTSRSEIPVTGDSSTQFMLANGQLEEYPTAWTISTERAREALEHFLQTEERSPSVVWNDDEAE
jgi:hypothetical protein